MSIHFLGELKSLTQNGRKEAKVSLIISIILFFLSRAHFIRKFWQSCIVMLSSGNQESRDAYNLISLHLSMLHSEEHVNYSNDEKYGIVEDDKFWEEIRKGLVCSNVFSSI